MFLVPAGGAPGLQALAPRGAAAVQVTAGCVAREGLPKARHAAAHGVGGSPGVAFAARSWQHAPAPVAEPVAGQARAGPPFAASSEALSAAGSVAAVAHARRTAGDARAMLADVGARRPRAFATASGARGAARGAQESGAASDPAATAGAGRGKGTSAAGGQRSSQPSAAGEMPLTRSSPPSDAGGAAGRGDAAAPSGGGSNPGGGGGSRVGTVAALALGAAMAYSLSTQILDELPGGMTNPLAGDRARAPKKEKEKDGGDVATPGGVTPPKRKETGEEKTIRENVTEEDKEVFKAAAEMLLAAENLDKGGDDEKEKEEKRARKAARAERKAEKEKEKKRSSDVAAAGAAGAARARALASRADVDVKDSNEAAALTPTSLVTRAFEGAVEVRSLLCSRLGFFFSLRLFPSRPSRATCCYTQLPRPFRCRDGLFTQPDENGSRVVPVAHFLARLVMLG